MGAFSPAFSSAFDGQSGVTYVTAALTGEGSLSAVAGQVRRYVPFMGASWRTLTRWSPWDRWPPDERKYLP